MLWKAQDQHRPYNPKCLSCSVRSDVADLTHCSLPSQEIWQATKTATLTEAQVASMLGHTARRPSHQSPPCMHVLFLPRNARRHDSGVLGPASHGPSRPDGGCRTHHKWPVWKHWTVHLYCHVQARPRSHRPSLPFSRPCTRALPDRDTHPLSHPLSHPPSNPASHALVPCQAEARTL
eukprot:365489-Chlamydomonas_euryale.AAC.3